MKILLTGSSGNLGKELVKIMPNCLHPIHEELNITDKLLVYNYVKKNKPEVLIHCAALTGIRSCEENKALAWHTNVLGSENLIQACEKYAKDCYFIYISTACVFYGDKGNYNEDDLPYPKNYYALTKLLGECATKYTRLKTWAVFRTNFVPRKKWPYPKAFIDRFGTYLFADDLASAINRTLMENITGIVHICGDKKLSMYELAKITTPDVEPMTLSEYNGPPLTKDMSLNTIRIKPFKLNY